MEILYGDMENLETFVQIGPFQYMPANVLGKISSSIDFLSMQPVEIREEDRDKIEELKVREITVYLPGGYGIFQDRKETLYHIETRASLKTHEKDSCVGVLNYTQSQIDEMMSKNSSDKLRDGPYNALSGNFSLRDA